jgi:translation initiation factor 2 beta subunit (eIF-2beta)/eIF-5
MIQINELEKMYAQYFKKFPDKESEQNSKTRIAKLKGFAK